MVPSGLGALLLLSSIVTPKLLLHLGTPTRKNACEAGVPTGCAEVRAAGDVSPEGRNYFVYVILDRGEWTQVSDLEFGIRYGADCPGDVADGKGIDVLDWRSCADMQRASLDSAVAPDAAKDPCGLLTQPVSHVASGWSAWPSPGSFIQLGWHEPRKEPFVVAGYFYVSSFSEDSMRIAGIPAGAEAMVDPRATNPAHGPRVGNAAVRTEIDPSACGSAVFSPGGTRPGTVPCDHP